MEILMRIPPDIPHSARGVQSLGAWEIPAVHTILRAYKVKCHTAQVPSVFMAQSLQCILGLYSGNIGDHGKEDGNYYIIGLNRSNICY